MKIVIDDKIPFIREAVSQITDEAIYKSGPLIGPDDIKDADALIVRTRTRCDKNLLAGSRLKFIATATIGFDHIDTEYLKEKGITWCNCPGCNANSVAQYIHSCLLLLEKEKGLDLSHTCIGLVGAGHVGTAVMNRITPLSVKVLLNDPPREQEEPEACFHSLEEIQQECDIISFHTPLCHNGNFPTFHLGNDTFFRHLQKRPVVINTSRGSVVDNNAFLQALKSGQISEAIIDTWENEPHINRELLDRAYISTPHIAGYSADGKANASRMVIEALCHFFHLPPVTPIKPPALPPSFKPAEDEKALALQLYNPHTDSRALKSHPEMFEELRGNYPLRREFYEKTENTEAKNCTK